MTIETRYAASASGSSRIESQVMYSAVMWRNLRRQKPPGIRHGGTRPALPKVKLSLFTLASIVLGDTEVNNELY
jgi:hypothetical protein